MQPFDYQRPTGERVALDLAAANPDASFIAGGTELLQLCKVGVAAPSMVIDISRLPFDRIEQHAAGVRIGAMARLADIADNAVIARDYPALVQALLASASPQVRNLATIGGNLLQRTRCSYFRSADLPCNKRQPGSGCGALAGENRLHAIFGASPHCAATHASDLAVALVALDACVHLRSHTAERVLPITTLFHVPGDTPERDTALAPGELIVAVQVPASAAARRSRYIKVRDRASFEFAVVSVAAALQIEDGVVRSARVAAGGVGTTPWRLGACEAALVGAPAERATFRAAADRATEGAMPLSQNGFKVELLRRTVSRALESAAWP